MHIPFCLKKCAYCDFFSDAASPQTMDKYLEALCAEIDSYQRYDKILVDTIFMGGGTPTLFGAKRMAVLMMKIREVFCVADDAEISIEMNPATADLDLLYALKTIGFNRISLGVQSFIAGELSMLGRAHNAKDAEDAILMIREVGFQNLNLDIMYAIPGQTLQSFTKTLEKALSFSPTHLSLYSLILEEGTEFWRKRHDLPLPNEAEELAMYRESASLLRNNGYEHYEISNYAKPGYDCKHNRKYWNLSPYIGIGVSAHSFYEGVRFANDSKLKEYLENPLSLRCNCEIVTPQSLAYEYVMLGLRTKEGICLSHYHNLCGQSLLQGRERFVKQCIEQGYIEQNGDRICITEEGFYVSNAILTEILA